jgi:hypothetical protein
VVSSLFCIAAWVSPRNVGHGLAVLFGAANLVSLVRGLWGGLPGVLLTVWLISGVLLLVLAWFSYYRRARPAWSVLVALCAVLSLAELFGVPRFARAFDISLWLVMISPAIKAIAAGALIAVHSDYSEREPARTAAAAATA